MKMRLLLILLSTLLSAACLPSGPNRFAENYRTFGVTGGPGITCLEPQMEGLSGGDLDRVKYDLWARGYETVGFSTFRGTYRTGYREQAMEYGRGLGACLVQFGEFQTHVIHDTELQTRRVESTRREKGKKKTTTTVTDITEHVPVAYDGYTYTAVYAIRTNPQDFGPLFASKLPDDIMRKLDSREGKLVLTVIEGSPAWHANIFPGDVLLSQTTEKGKPWVSGQTVVTRVYRDGKMFTRKVPWKSTPPHDNSAGATP